MGEGLLCIHTVELQAGSGCPREASLEKGPDELESDLQDGSGGGGGGSPAGGLVATSQAG